MRVLVHGCNGKMGRIVAQVVSETAGMEVSVGVDIADGYSGSYPVHVSLSEVHESADVIIDFSHPRCLNSVLAFAVERGVPAVIGTTGFGTEQGERIADASRSVAILHSANMSFGMNVLFSLIEQATVLARYGFDVEIIEKHHRQKIDAPSGTALAIAGVINDRLGNTMNLKIGRHSKAELRQQDEIGIHAIRGGTIVGEHDIIFAGPSEVIEIRHSALSREVFAHGAVRAARFIVGLQPGLYTMRDLIQMQL